jgi:ABC-type transport system involved in cytochrome c biogenesis ATPase subunit
MRLTSLAATDALSFKALKTTIPEGLSVVVGPNGSGKTNLSRLLRLGLDGIAAAASRSPDEMERDWASAGWYGSPTFEVRIGVEFDTRPEQALIHDWARAAVLTAMVNPAMGEMPLLEEYLGDLGAEFLTSGELVIRRLPQLHQRWTVGWETRNPKAHVGLWATQALAVGPLPEEVTLGPLGSIQQILLKDGPLPSLNAHTVQNPEVIAEKTRVLGGFTLLDVLKGARPVEMVARPLGGGPEVPPMDRLVERVPAQHRAGRDHITFADVLSHLMTDALVVTDNRRAPWPRRVSVEALTKLTGVEDGSGLAGSLLILKNGDAAQRRRYQDLTTTFNEVTGRTLDVQQRPDLATEPATSLAVTPVIVDQHPDTDEAVDVPLHLAGAGLEEAALLALLLTDDHKTLVLDEPATNLSATAQRRFLTALRQRRGEQQTLIITHSPHLIPASDVNDLKMVTRLDRRAGRTTAHQPEVNQSDDNLRGLLGQSQIRDLLFAAGVVLVEGASDDGAFRVWLADHLPDGVPTPETAHVTFLNVGGEEDFPRYARLMGLLGVPYAVVADGPAFRHNGPLLKMPDVDIPDSLRQEDVTFRDAEEWWADHRVRTLATEFGIGTKAGEIEAFGKAQNPETWARVSASFRTRNKPRLVYEFASRIPRPAPVTALWNGLLNDLGLPPRP